MNVKGLSLLATAHEQFYQQIMFSILDLLISILQHTCLKAPECFCQTVLHISEMVPVLQFAKLAIIFQQSWFLNLDGCKEQAFMIS